jgi:hypothetical protein
VLFDKITLEIEGYTNDPVAGADLGANLVRARALMEIDWAEITEKQFKDYIMEHVYVNLGDDE